MAIPDIEESRRIASELESQERKRGGLDFELPLNFDLDDLEEFGLPALAIMACIGLSFFLGSFAPIIYLTIVFGVGVVLALAWMVVEPIYEFVMDNLEDIRDSIVVLPALLLGIGVFATSLSQGKNIIESIAISVISFAMLGGLTQLAFWLLEKAMGHWGWALFVLFVVILLMK